MSKNNLIELKNPEPLADPIAEILRNGAKKLLAEALEAEIAGFLSQYAYLKDDQGRMRVPASLSVKFRPELALYLQRRLVFEIINMEMNQIGLDSVPQYGHLTLEKQKAWKN